jgi:hypothetical protein
LQDRAFAATMHRMLASRVLVGLAVGAIVFAACGGKTDVPTTGPSDEGGAETGAGTPDVVTQPDVNTGGRVCPPNCTVGHQCCEVTCGGPPVAMPSSCCSCLQGEVDSLGCPNGKCGG